MAHERRVTLILSFGGNGADWAKMESLDNYLSVGWGLAHQVRPLPELELHSLFSSPVLV